MSKAVTRLSVNDPSERRDHNRRDVGTQSTLRVDGRPDLVLVRDLSQHGFAVETPQKLSVGASVTIGLPGFGSAPAIIKRIDTAGYGCQFVVPLAPSAFAAAFGECNVIVAPFKTLLLPQEPILVPPMNRWSIAARGRLIVGASLALWVVALKMI